MKDVGDKFGAGELILPFVLQSAEVMKKAVAHLEQFLERSEGVSKGKVVLATVFGDVHDIGKNLVNTILSNNGYTVYDLGKQVPMNAILEKAVEVNADAIGLSALLVSTSKQMPVCVQGAGRARSRVPDRRRRRRDQPRFRAADRVLDVDGRARAFEPGVYYAKDAFEGLEIMDRLVGVARRARSVPPRDARRGARDARARPLGRTAPLPPTAARARETLATADVPRPPFFGPRVVDDVDVRDAVAALRPAQPLPALVGRRERQGRGVGTRSCATSSRRGSRRISGAPKRAALLVPRAVYGVLPGRGLRRRRRSSTIRRSGPRDRAVSRSRARSAASTCAWPTICASRSTARASDVIALQVVTVGARRVRAIDAAQARGEYSESYFLHGFSVQAAEALAESHAPAHARASSGSRRDRGKRYSWGYGACPDLSQHETSGGCSMRSARSAPR